MASITHESNEQERQDLAHTMTRGLAIKFGSLSIVKALSLVYQIIILRMLSPVEAGFFFLASGFVTIVSQFMSLGLLSAVLRYAPLYASRKEPERLKSLIWTLSVTTIAASLLAFVLFIIFGDAIAQFYGQPIGPAMPWIALLSLLFMLFNFWSSVLDGLKQFGRSGLLQAGQQVLRVGLTVVAFFVIGRTADAAFGTYALTLTLLSAYLIWYLWGWLSRLPGKLVFSTKELIESMRFGIPAYISSVADVITTYMDVILVGRFMGLEAVAAYSAIIIFVRNVAPFVILPVGVVQQPLLVEQYARGSKLYTDLVREGSRWTMYLGVPFLGLFLLYSTAILGLVSPQYVSSAGLIWFFTPMVLLVLLSNSSRGALFARGLSWVLLLVSIVVLTLNFILNWLFIPVFGLMGSAMATSLSIVIGELCAIVLARKLAGAKLHPDIIKCVAAGMVMVGIGLVPLPAFVPVVDGTSLSNWAWNGGVVALGAAIVVSAIAYGLSMLVLGAFSDEDRGTIWRIFERYPLLKGRIGKPGRV